MIKVVEKKSKLEHVERKVTNDKKYSRKWKLEDAQKMFIQLLIGDCKSLDVEVHYQNSRTN